MRIGITGASGYIGGKLIDKLATKPNYDILALSRTKIIAPSNITTGLLDLLQPSSMDQHFEGIDTIVHLAGLNEADCEKFPFEAKKLKGSATLELIEYAISNNVNRIIYLSTSKIFGSNPVGKIDEKSPPRPENHYAIAHKLAEDYLVAGSLNGKIENIILRLSNSFGPPFSPKTNAWSIIGNDLCRQAIINGCIELQSPGLAWRNFISIDDVTAAIQHSINLPSSKILDGIFHIGGSGSLQIIELAKLISHRAKKLYDINVEITYPKSKQTKKPEYVDWRIDKIKNTGWAPKSDLFDTIDATLKYCEKYFETKYSKII